MAGEKSVRLSVLGNNVDAKAKLDEINVKAEELKALHPELSIGIDTAAASAKLKIFRDELTATKTEVEAEPLNIRVTSAKARAQLDLIKKQADGLRLINPTIIPRINDMEASAQLAVLRGEITKTEAKSETLGKTWEVTKYAMLGLAGGIGYGVVKAAGFNAEMERVHTQAGIAQSQIAGLSQGVLQLAGQVGANPDSLAESFYHVASNMASMGATGPQMMNAVKVAAEGAKVGGADLVDVTNALGAAIASGIPGVQNYQSAMGALNATVGAGDMKMQDLAEALGTGFLSNVKIYGSTLNDVGAILATFGDNNIRGAQAGTQLRMSVQSIAVQAKSAGPYLKQLGLHVGELGHYQSLHGTVATINLLVHRLKAAGIAQSDWGNIITQLFGKKAGAGIAVLIDQYDRLNSKSKVLADGAKSFGDAVKKNDQTAQQQFDRLKSSAEALATSMGVKLLPAATKIAGWLANFVNGLQKGSVAAQGIAGIIGTVLAGIALKKLEDGLKGAVDGFEGLWSGGKRLTGFIGQMVGKMLGLTVAQEGATVATEGETAAQEGLNGAMDANIIGLIVLAIAGLVIGIVELWKHSAAFRDFWIGAWHLITRIVSDAVQWIKGHWQLLVGIITGPVGIAVLFVVHHFTQIKNDVTRIVGGVLNWIKTNWQKIIAWFVDPLGMAVFEIRTHTHQIAHAFDVARHAVAAILAGARHDIAHAFDLVRHDISAFADWVPHEIAHLWDMARHFEAAGLDVLRHTAAVGFDNLRHDTAVMIVDVVRFFERLPGMIIHTLARLPGQLLNAGRNIIDGLIHGITSAAADIPSIMSGLASDVASYFTDPLKIFSPSRVFMEHGKNIVQGAIIGIQTDAPQLRSAMQRLGEMTAAAGIGNPGNVAAAAAEYGNRAMRVEWVGGDAADQGFMTWLKENIRINGGDPEVLGR